ncbi:MAG: hypothetical protein ACREJN_18525 [Nitrospiraceae bacterium]
MIELDAIRDTYLTLRDCFTVTSLLVSKSTKGSTFHETIFLGQSPEEAKRRLAMAKTELDDWAIVALVSIFERILFDHPKSPLRSKTARERARGLDKAIEHFEPRVSSTVFEDVKRLRQYRHWVAHGKRWVERPVSADPISSYQRLVDFLGQAGLGAK